MKALHDTDKERWEKLEKAVGAQETYKLLYDSVRLQELSTNSIRAKEEGAKEKEEELKRIEADRKAHSLARGEPAPITPPPEKDEFAEYLGMKGGVRPQGLGQFTT
jgi:hypothetical protein